MAPDFDLLVAGGGPAGLAAAIGGALRGMRVAVVEPRPGVLDKACGEGLMPPALRSLEALGVSITAGQPFVGVRYLEGRWAAEAVFPGGEAGLGLRRLVLHERLRSRALAVGVELIEGRVTDIEQGAEAVRAAGLRARWLIVADGLASPTRRRLGLEVPSRSAARIGLRRHFGVAPWSPFVEVWWAPGVEAYVTPVSPTEIGLALLTEAGEGAGLAGQARYDHLLTRLPALRERLRDPTSTLRGAGPFERRLRRRVLGRVLLVGDAAGYLDPITGEGIRLGLDTAAAALAAIHAGDPQRYEADWWRLTRSYRWMTGGLLALARSPRLRGLIVPGAALIPGLMRGILRHLAG